MPLPILPSAHPAGAARRVCGPCIMSTGEQQSNLLVSHNPGNWFFDVIRIQRVGESPKSLTTLTLAFYPKNRSIVSKFPIIIDQISILRSLLSVTAISVFKRGDWWALQPFFGCFITKIYVLGFRNVLSPANDDTSKLIYFLCSKAIILLLLFTLGITLLELTFKYNNLISKIQLLLIKVLCLT